MNYIQLKNMKKNKLVNYLDKYHKGLFLKIIGDVLEIWEFIPLDKEDLYNELLYYQIELTDNFDESSGVPFLNYIIIKSKFFLKNKCRYYSTNKFKVLNRSFVLEDYEKNLATFTRTETYINIDKLNDFEKKVFNAILEFDFSKSKMARHLGITKYFLEKSLKSIKFKILEDIKN